MVESATENTATVNATEEENKVEEQDPFIEETFDDPIIPETKFNSDWTLWEHYEAADGASVDYTQSMCKACWFNDLVSFSTAWNTIPHADLTNIFFNDETKMVKM